MPGSQTYNNQNFFSVNNGQITTNTAVSSNGNPEQDDTQNENVGSTNITSEDSNDTSSANVSENIIPLGSSGESGAIAESPSAENNKPNIFLNFKEKVFSNRGLIFRFKTSDISDAVGTTASSWSSDADISNITLSASSGNPLTVVESYGKKFYELNAGSKIFNNSVPLTPSVFPSYTILVFALGRTDDTASQDLMVVGSSSIHKFIENKIYNPGSLNINPQTHQFHNFFSYNGDYHSNFNGSTLHTIRYGPTLNNASNSLLMFGLLNLPNFDYTYRSSKTTHAPDLLEGSNGGKFYKPIYHNLYNLRTNLSSPDSPDNFVVNNGSVSNFQRFTLFFVQMHTTLMNESSYEVVYSQNVGNQKFATSTTIPVKKVKNETFVNKQQTSLLYQHFFPTFDLDSSLSYILSLGNEKDGANGSTKLFLFDYMHGVETTEEKRNETSNNIIESLAYDYRSLLLKSSSDLQISNATKSLQFPVPLAHPFINLYSK